MAKNTSTKRPSLPAEPPYDLAFVKYESLSERRCDAYAEVNSPLLDRLMHPTGSVSVWFVGRAIAAKGGPGFVLEGFQLASLADYLRSQAAVRESLEHRFNEYLDELPPRERSKGAAGLWKHVEVLQLVLAPRTIPTREQLAGLKKLNSRVNLRRVIANSDKADTRSSFTVVMRVTWDEEHFTKADFRDGGLVKIASA